MMTTEDQVRVLERKLVQVQAVVKDLSRTLRVLERKLVQVQAVVKDLSRTLRWYACTPNSRARAALDRNGLSDE